MKTNRIIAALLTLLGFSRCGDIGKEMYGLPPVHYAVKGAVTDADDKPLENIRVVLKLRDDETDENLAGAQRFRDTVYTDSKGRFEIDSHLAGPLPLALIAQDIDGEEKGGEFRTEEKIFNFSQENFDSEEWAYIEEIDFTLTKIEENDENK